MLRNVETLTRRELAVYFYSPIAYVVLTVFLVVTGIFFGTDGFVPGNPASLRVVFGSIMPLILVFVLPMITMRLLSEELRLGVGWMYELVTPFLGLALFGQDAVHRAFRSHIAPFVEQ